jgi:predicted glutamine amidotransferase
VKEAQEVVLAASVPLSNENWIAMEEGEIKVLQNGRIITP